MTDENRSARTGSYGRTTTGRELRAIERARGPPGRGRPLSDPANERGTRE